MSRWLEHGRKPCFFSKASSSDSSWHEGRGVARGTRSAIEAAPYYLPTRVLRAEYLAVGTQDVKMFDSDLDFVLSADPNMNPDAGITAENIKDIDKAKGILAKRHELFDRQALDNAN